jgi:uncharacterized surface protein with fasciclin (FAS1) repeats
MKKLVAGAAVVAIAATAIATVPAGAKQPKPAPNIVSTAVEVNSSGAFAGQFDTVIAAALCTPGIVDALSARGQLTLFAPTDDAFANLGLTPENVCSALPQATLADVLTYHVAKGNRDAASVLDSTQIRMLNGDRVTVDAPAVALIDGLGRQANIIVTDVAAGNGVIHAIDSVLLPPGFGS